MTKVTKKRIADWLEKMSVASAAVGLFQGVLLGALVAIVALWLSVKLSNQLEEDV